MHVLVDQMSKPSPCRRTNAASWGTLSFFKLLHASPENWCAHTFNHREFVLQEDDTESWATASSSHNTASTATTATAALSHAVSERTQALRAAFRRNSTSDEHTAAATNGSGSAAAAAAAPRLAISAADVRLEARSATSSHGGAGGGSRGASATAGAAPRFHGFAGAAQAELEWLPLEWTYLARAGAPLL